FLAGASQKTNDLDLCPSPLRALHVDRGERSAWRKSKLVGHGARQRAFIRRRADDRFSRFVARKQQHLYHGGWTRGRAPLAGFNDRGLCVKQQSPKSVE